MLAKLYWWFGFSSLLCKKSWIRTIFCRKKSNDLDLKKARTSRSINYYLLSICLKCWWYLFPFQTLKKEFIESKWFQVFCTVVHRNYFRKDRLFSLFLLLTTGKLENRMWHMLLLSQCCKWWLFIWSGVYIFHTKIYIFKPISSWSNFCPLTFFVFFQPLIF